MAKIENTTVYPTVLPAASDLLIATDVSNNNKTVTFLVSDIVGPGGVDQDLQSVLTTGNIATENINLTGNINVIGTVYPTTVTAVGSTGSPGQILSSTGTGIQWIFPGSNVIPTWNETLISDPTSTEDAIMSSAYMTFNGAGGGIVINSPSTLLNTGTSIFNGSVSINSTSLGFNNTGTIIAGGTVGTAGQFLTSTGTGVAWSSTLPPGSCCTLQETIAAGNTSVSQSVTMSGSGIWTFGINNSIDSFGTNEWSGNNIFSATGTTITTSAINLSGSLSDGTTTGTVGQVLTSTGSGGVSWAAAGGGTQDLQSVLDLGNTATGGNANITISGFIQPGLLTDTSGSVGSSGQYLSSTGTGLAWVNTTCCSLDDTLTVGSTSGQTITMTGSANIITPFVEPNQILDYTGVPGSVGQVLTVNTAGTGIQWINPAGSAVTQVSTTTPGISTGTPIVITPGTGNVVVKSMAYNGGTEIGHVPAGGISTTFLNGSGVWSTPIGSGIVTSLGGSVGPNITNTISGTATVPIVDSALNATGTPNGTTFLRGDNVWAVPLAGGSGTNNFTVTKQFSLFKALPANNVVTFANLGQSGYLTNNRDVLVQESTLWPDDVGNTWTPIQLKGGVVHKNAATGNCGATGSVDNFCSAAIEILNLHATTDTLTVRVYKIPSCASDTPVLLGEADLIATGGSGTYVCAEISGNSTVISNGENVMIAIKGLNSVTEVFTGAIALRFNTQSGT